MAEILKKDKGTLNLGHSNEAMKHLIFKAMKIDGLGWVRRFEGRFFRTCWWIGWGVMESVVGWMMALKKIHPCFNPWSLRLWLYLDKKVFADVIKDLQIQSSWIIHMGHKSNDKRFYKRHRQKWRRQCEDSHRDCSDAATRNGWSPQMLD